MLIVWFKGMLIKSDFTSNGTMFLFDGTFSALTFSSNDFEFFTAYSDSLKGNNNVAKYFDK